MAEKRSRATTRHVLGAAEKIQRAIDMHLVMSDEDEDAGRKVKSRVVIPPQKEGSMFSQPKEKEAAEKTEEEKLQDATRILDARPKSLGAIPKTRKLTVEEEEANLEEMSTDMAEKLLEETMPGSEISEVTGSEILDSSMEVEIPASSTAELDKREGGELGLELNG